MSATAKTLTAVGVAAVVAVGGTVAISAASASTGSAQTQAAGGPGGFGGPGGGGLGGYGSAPDGASDTGAVGRGAAGRGGAMALLAGALHGDVVVSSGSSTVTERLQRGAVTAVGSGSLTVRSTDGYVSTYAVPNGVDVSGVSTGTSVLVLGTVQGSTVTLTAVFTADGSGTGAVGGRPLPGGELPGGQLPGSRGSGGGDGSGGAGSGGEQGGTGSAPATA
ncbi:hypothetical protein [Nakamurella endophytica]|uniref:DUF5666 domain-containing protein n=1 Tax=Nakamurella endophytica TaxID=1748367 RepID=A0A917SLD7_9ACTN|nr:hypothetical protein [Nakamurella endophytica]GGL88435.1 hypothetical protein GCM10011594_05090 [Nakamurella endophytica]